MAVIDVAGYVADLKDHSVDHGFHVHDERHFVETYSLRQVWEVDLHPEEGCGGPLDLHLALEVDPRTLLSFEDAVIDLPEDVEPPDEFHFPLTFTWGLPPLPHGPDLLRLAIDLAGVGGIDLPLEVSAIDSFASATDAPDRRLSILARYPVSLARILGGEELLCEVFDRSPGRQPVPARRRPRLARRMTGRGSARRETPRAEPPGLWRLLRTGGAIGLTVALGAGLLGCANGAALGLVRQACHHVQISLALYQTAEHQSDAKLAADEQGPGRRPAHDGVTAGRRSRRPGAAVAGPHGHPVRERPVARVRLVSALRQQCAVAQTGGIDGAHPPGHHPAGTPRRTVTGMSEAGTGLAGRSDGR